jgi:cytoskeletal protein RodZ
MSEPTTSAPIDIGATLRQARLKHGQSLDVVHQHTRIPKKFLEAMENNRFDEFPALVYLRGFLKSYCEHLDVEFEPLWNQIAPQKQQKDGSSDSAAPKAPEPRQERHAPPAPPAVREHHEEDAPSGMPSNQSAIVPVLILAAIVVGGGLVWVARKGKSAAPPPPPPSAPPAAIAPIRSKEKMVLKLKFHKETWVRLHCDGVLRFEGRAPAGFSQEWTAMNDFTLRARTPEDVSLVLDGKDVPLTSAMQEPSGDYKIGRQ